MLYITILGAVIGDEHIVVVSLWKALAGIEAHAKRCHMGAEQQCGRCELSTGAIFSVDRVEHVALMAEREAKMLALLCYDG